MKTEVLDKLITFKIKSKYFLIKCKQNNYVDYFTSTSSTSFFPWKEESNSCSTCVVNISDDMFGYAQRNLVIPAPNTLGHAH